MRRVRWPLRMSVDVPAVQLRRSGFVDEAAQVPAVAAIDQASQTLKITESTLIQDDDPSREAA